MNSMKKDEALYLTDDDDERIEKMLLQPAAVWRLLPLLSATDQQHARRLILGDPMLRAALRKAAATKGKDDADQT